VEPKGRDSASSFVGSEGFSAEQTPRWLSEVIDNEPFSTKLGGWIDACWKEVRFQWDPHHSCMSATSGITSFNRRKSVSVDNVDTEGSQTNNDDVCIHFSHDNWKPDQMQKNENGCWVVHRVLPPGKHFYFFSFFDDDHTTKAAADHGKVVQRGECMYAQSLLPHSVRQLNCVDISPRKEAFKLKQELPRRPWYGGKIAAATVWTLETSLFKDRLAEVESKDFWDAGILEKAFENDWIAVTPKLEKFIKVDAERDELKAVCAKHFPVLRACFRYYSAEGSGMDPYSITFNDFGDFCQDCEIVDDKKCSISAIDTIFIATNFEVEKSDDNPDHALERPEFLEAVTRLAVAKFSGNSLTPAEAFDALLTNHVITNADRHDCDGFRTENFYLQDIDEIMRLYEHDLRAVLAQYGTSRRRLDGKRRPHLSLEAFMKILQDGNLIDGRLSLEKAKFCFVNSKFTSSNENGNRDAHKFLSFVDFLEALLWIKWVRTPVVSTTDTEGKVSGEKEDAIGDMVLLMLENIRSNNKALRYE
jgi:hypothetical protein